MVDKNLDAILAGGAPEVVLRRERRDSKAEDTFVDDIKSILKREAALESRRSRDADLRAEAKDDDDDEAEAKAAAPRTAAASFKAEEPSEHKGGRDAAYVASDLDDYADAKGGSDESDSDGDDDDVFGDIDSGAESEEEADLFSGGAGMSANLLALLGKAPKPDAKAEAPAAKSRLQDGIFQTKAGSWVPPTTFGLANSTSLLG